MKTVDVWIKLEDCVNEQSIKFGKALLRLRENKGISKEELSEKSGVSLCSLDRYEKGLNVPTVRTLNKLLEIIDKYIKEDIK